MPIIYINMAFNRCTRKVQYRVLGRRISNSKHQVSLSYRVLLIYHVHVTLSITLRLIWDAEHRRGNTIPVKEDNMQTPTVGVYSR